MEKKVKKIELIGKSIKVVASKNKSVVGIEGKVIDETKNTLKIMTKKGEKKLIKQGIAFTLTVSNKEIMIKGDEITLPPEERIKLK